MFVFEPKIPPDLVLLAPNGLEFCWGADPKPPPVEFPKRLDIVETECEENSHSERE